MTSERRNPAVRRERVLAWAKRQDGEFEVERLTMAISMRRLAAQKVLSRLAAEGLLERVQLGTYRVPTATEVQP